MIPYIEPSGKALLSLTTQHTVYLGMMVKIPFIVAQKLRTAKYHHHLRQ